MDVPSCCHLRGVGFFGTEVGCVLHAHVISCCHLRGVNFFGTEVGCVMHAHVISSCTVQEWLSCPRKL